MELKVGHLYKCLVDLNKGKTQRWKPFIFMPMSPPVISKWSSSQPIMWIGNVPQQIHPNRWFHHYHRDGWRVEINDVGIKVILDEKPNNHQVKRLATMPLDMVAPVA
jgi:hypothetical protein